MTTPTILQNKNASIVIQDFVDPANPSAPLFWHCLPATSLTLTMTGESTDIRTTCDTGPKTAKGITTYSITGSINLDDEKEAVRIIIQSNIESKKSRVRFVLDDTNPASFSIEYQFTNYTFSASADTSGIATSSIDLANEDDPIIIHPLLN